MKTHFSHRALACFEFSVKLQQHRKRLRYTNILFIYLFIFSGRTIRDQWDCGWPFEAGELRSQECPLCGRRSGVACRLRSSRRLTSFEGRHVGACEP